MSVSLSCRVALRFHRDTPRRCHPDPSNRRHRRRKEGRKEGPIFTRADGLTGVITAAIWAPDHSAAEIGTRVFAPMFVRRPALRTDADVSMFKSAINNVCMIGLELQCLSSGCVCQLPFLSTLYFQTHDLQSPNSVDAESHIRRLFPEEGALFRDKNMYTLPSK